VQYEPGALSAQTVAALKKKGHRLHQLRDTYGNMQAVLWDRKSGRVSAASDPRGIGAAFVFGSAKHAAAQRGASRTD
jgi:gamma-glutamyltranspeptidase/glutathione hydrolase